MTETSASPPPETAGASQPSDAPDPAETADIRTGARMEAVPQKPGEVGGGDKPEPTRFGDWEVGGRCTDF